MPPIDPVSQGADSQFVVRLYNLGLYDKAASSGKILLQKRPEENGTREMVVLCLAFQGKFSELRDVVSPEQAANFGAREKAILALATARGAWEGLSEADTWQSLLEVQPKDVEWLADSRSQKGPLIDKRVFWSLVCATLSPENESLILIEQAKKISPKDSFLNERLAKIHKGHDRLTEEVACLKLALKGAKGDRKHNIEAEIAKAEKDIKAKAEYEEAVRKIREGGGGT